MTLKRGSLINILIFPSSAHSGAPTPATRLAGLRPRVLRAGPATDDTARRE